MYNMQRIKRSICCKNLDEMLDFMTISEKRPFLSSARTTRTAYFYENVVISAIFRIRVQHKRFQDLALLYPGVRQLYIDDNQAGPS